jgi:hypothetical protein
MGGQEVWLHAYLTLAPGGGEIRKKEIGPKCWLDKSLGGPERQSWSYTDKKILSPFPRIKPPLLYQPAIHSVTTLSQSAHNISSNQELSEIVLFKDYKIPMDNNTIFSFILITVQTLTENNSQERKAPSQREEITILS